MEFVKRIIRVDPDPWQANGLKALGNGHDVAIRACHGPGKTAFDAWVILWYMTTHPFCRVPCTAPTYKQLKRRLWPEINKWAHKSELLEELFEIQKESMHAKAYPDTWFAAAESSNNSDNLAGYHSDHLLFIVDEAASVPEDVMSVVDGARTKEKNQIVLTGNPTRNTGYFADTFQKFSEDFFTIQVGWEDSPRVDEKFRKKMAKRWGEDSNVFRIRVLGEFPDQDEDSFIPVSWCYDAAQRELEIDKTMVSIGADIARYGSSESVITTRKGPVVTDVQRFSKQSTTATASRIWTKINDLLDETGIDHVRVKVDDTGMGGAVTDQLESWIKQDDMEDQVEIVPVKAQGSPPDEYKEQYNNNASAAWGVMKDRLEHNTIQIPYDDELIGQMNDRRFSFIGKDKIKLEPKDRMKSRGRPSPDRADSLALCFFEPPSKNREPDWVSPMSGLERENPLRAIG